MNKLYIITGPAEVGKSTVSKNLASKLEKSVLIEGDDIYNQFVGGRISPWKENAPLDLFWDNCFLLIDNYLENGYDVVFNYIIKKEKLKQINNKFKNYEIIFVVLLIDQLTILKRDLERPIDCQMKERCLILLQEFIDEKYENNNIIDTTKLDINQEVGMILTDERFILKKQNIDDIKNPEDILKYMIDNISYGWLDIVNQKHINNMKNFRLLYRTSSLEEIINNKIGTCIEQVWLMKNLFDKINIKSKMFCTRIYEKNNFNNLGEEEHMHCFLLYYQDGKVYHIEHPNFYRIGIYEYNNEKEAIKSINDYFIKLSNGISRPVTEFYEVKENQSFKEFNNYINSLDGVKNE